MVNRVVKNFLKISQYKSWLCLFIILENFNNDIKYNILGGHKIFGSEIFIRILRSLLTRLEMQQQKVFCEKINYELKPKKIKLLKDRWHISWNSK